MVRPAFVQCANLFVLQSLSYALEFLSGNSSGAKKKGFEQNRRQIASLGTQVCTCLISLAMLNATS